MAQDSPAAGSDRGIALGTDARQLAIGLRGWVPGDSSEDRGWSYVTDRSLNAARVIVGTHGQHSGTCGTCESHLTAAPAHGIACTASRCITDGGPARALQHRRTWNGRRNSAAC